MRILLLSVNVFQHLQFNCPRMRNAVKENNNRSACIPLFLESLYSLFCTVVHRKWKIAEGWKSREEHSIENNYPFFSFFPWWKFNRMFQPQLSHCALTSFSSPIKFYLKRKVVRSRLNMMYCINFIYIKCLL